MTRTLCGSWLLRLVLAAVLCVVGPFSLADDIAHDASSCACDHSGDQAGCPPACPDACGISVPAVVSEPCEFRAPAAVPERCVRDEAVPHAAPPPDGVFHPPTP